MLGGFGILIFGGRGATEIVYGEIFAFGGFMIFFPGGRGIFCIK
jgi:hypothetical protein